MSLGTGTVIDCRQGEALILTCGHIFRDSAGKGRIEVDLFELELDKLKGITRKTQPLGLTRYENSAEHSWQLTLLAMSLEPYAAAPVDINRARHAICRAKRLSGSESSRSRALVMPSIRSTTAWRCTCSRSAARCSDPRSSR